MEIYQIEQCYLEDVAELKEISFDTFWDTFSAQNTEENEISLFKEFPAY